MRIFGIEHGMAGHLRNPGRGADVGVARLPSSHNPAPRPVQAPSPPPMATGVPAMSPVLR